VFTDPRYPDWLPPIYHPPLEVWWAPTLAVGVLSLALVAWLTRRRSWAARLGGVVACLVITGATGWATQRYPPPAWSFAGDRPLVVVISDPTAPRRDSQVLDVTRHCTVRVHPDDLDAARHHGPWTVYPGAFPLPQVDQAQAGELVAVAYGQPHHGPAAVAGGAVHAAIDACGTPEVQQRWAPPTLTVRGVDRVWLVQPKTVSATAAPPAVLEPNGRCALVVEGVELAKARVRFADASGEVVDGVHGMAALEIGERAVAMGFAAVPEGPLTDDQADEVLQFGQTWADCLRDRPEVQALWGREP